MECIIPLIMAQFIDEISTNNLVNIGVYSVILVIMAFLSLLFGILSGKYCAIAAAGFGANLRHDVYTNVQGFSFANIDKFSTSSLVTRLTTDITNVQMSFMMIIRIAVRSPFMLIFSIVMAFVVCPSLAWIFVIILPVLGCILFWIIRKAMPLFNSVFKKYDNLNSSIEENIKGIRVVKSYVRENYEKEKFNKAASNVRDDFTRGQRQLLSIARAAIADAPVMILDEATSSIDTRTEILVQRGTDKLMEGRTVFVIAHRLSTVQNANAIMVLDHGHIIERGDHDDLIRQHGTYYSLYTGVFELE